MFNYILLTVNGRSDQITIFLLEGGGVTLSRVESQQGLSLT